jgi:hypothetical protein
MPVSVPEGLSFGIDIDPDPDKLPTTHTCFGIVRPPLSFLSYASQLIAPISFHQHLPVFFAGANNSAFRRQQRAIETKT